ncbi:MAG TPA: hypothetical protein VMV70_06575, partial [Gallionella sp.]|nr:hypothetical protein [Gallionella sp.]
MKVSIAMLPVGIPGRKLNGQFRDAVNKPTVLVAGIILFTARSGIHRPDTVRLIKSGTIRTVQSTKTWGDLCDEFPVFDSRNQQEVHNVEKRFEYLAQLAAVFVLVAGCFLV